jgi:hypothetical protein
LRELDRIPTSVAIVGAGRLGTALAAALRATGLEVDGPLGRGADPRGVDAVLLCVPDGQIAAAAAAVTPGTPVGHCSGATGLDVLAGHEAFSLHPLMTVPHDGEADKTASRAPRGRSPQKGIPHVGEPEFAGAGAAVAGATPARSRSRAGSRSASGCARRPSPTRTAPPTTRPPRSRRTS